MVEKAEKKKALLASPAKMATGICYTQTKNPYDTSNILSRASS
jgi:hypothetical protein